MSRRRLVALASAIALGLAACSPAATAGPLGSGATSPGPSTPAASPVTGLPTQTETDFGRIWDAAPPSFPVFPGAAPTTDTGEGPVSALLLIDGADPRAVATFYRDALQAHGLVASLDGPLEDGAIIVTGSDEYRCETEVGVRPAGTTTLITVLYGAGCPFE